MNTKKQFVSNLNYEGKIHMEKLQETFFLKYTITFL